MTVYVDVSVLLPAGNKAGFLVVAFFIAFMVVLLIGVWVARTRVHGYAPQGQGCQVVQLRPVHRVLLFAGIARADGRNQKINWILKGMMICSQVNAQLARAISLRLRGQACNIFRGATAGAALRV